MRLLVPLGKSKMYVGIAVALHDKPVNTVTDDGKAVEFKNVISIVDETPILLPKQYELWKWISEYYMCPLGDILKAAMPSGLKAEEAYRPRTETYIALTPQFSDGKALHIAFSMLQRAAKQKAILETYLRLRDEANDTNGVTREELTNVAKATSANVKALIDRGILYTYEVEVGRLNNSGEPHPENIKPLTTTQSDAYNRLLMQMMRRNVTLMHGVTSSGKTEMYIHLIQKTIDEGKQVLYLLPEIALTVQMMERLRRVFGNRLGIYHSRYSDAERVEIWKKQLSGHPYDIILGARSAVFLPYLNLGLVIVDEEHESSFKQQEPSPRYHARSVAIVLASKYKGCKVLLGTATPSLESFYNAKQGKYGYVELKERYKGIMLPHVEIIDIKDLRRRKMMKGPLSPQMIAAMRKALENGKQVILFQNRRGFAPMLECKTCGWVPKCENCDVSLTLHKNTNTLTCHYCGYTYKVPEKCPCCESNEVSSRGYGTERIEDVVEEIFPDARIARMDLDTTRTHNAYERIISDFSSGKTNVLIGTQMVSKGLDFDNVGLVGITDADTMLNYPDFRAYEQAFQMMCQVSGRAGRKGERGLVMLQTRNADMPVIRQVATINNDVFYRETLAERKEYGYPPFRRLIYIYLKHRHEDVTESAAVYMGGILRQWFSSRVLGPDKPAVARVKTLAIRKIVMKLENGIDLAKVRLYLKKARQQVVSEKRFAAVQIFFDVDPL